MPIASQKYIRGMASTSMMLIIAYQYYSSSKLDDEEGEEEETNKDKGEFYWPIFIQHLLCASDSPKLFMCIISLCSSGDEEMAGGDNGLAKRL